MKKSIFRKMHGVPDKVITQNLVQHHVGLQHHARVLNHHGRVILWLVALGVVQTLAVIYITMWR